MIELGCEIKNAEDAKKYTNDNFERLSTLEAEIEKALDEIKKMSGMENFSSMMNLADVLAMSMGVFGSLISGLFGKNKVEALVDNQQVLHKNLIKVTRVQVLLFEFQRVTAEILNDLFEMCSSNIEVVDTTIETLRERLSSASSSVSDTTKKNVRDLIRKLMARRDSLMKLDALENEVKNLKLELKELKKG